MERPATPTYADYATAGGTITAAEYASNIAEAVDAVSVVVGGNAVDGTALPYWTRAVFAAVTLTACPRVKSYSAGKVSESYGESTTREGAIEAALSGSGLLCRWL